MIILIFYFFIAPQFIQGGDTSELVMASYHRLVAHPPGYPLFTWLQFIWTHVFDVSTVFWRASILSSLFGIIALAAVVFPLKGLKYGTWAALLLIGLKAEFIEASVLPDVFSLHAVFVALIGYFFLFSHHAKKDLWVIVLFIFSLTNHHTSIFLFPIFLYSVGHLVQRKDYRSLILSLGIGLSLFISFYLSILLLNPGHPLSWGQVNNLTGLVHHFLRSDYGTFQLAATNSSSSLEAFKFMLKNLWPMLLVGLVVGGVAIKDKDSSLKSVPFILWSLVLFMTLLFPLAMNVTSEHIGAEVLKRFHVMPLIVLSLWIVFLLTKLAFTKKKSLSILLSTIPALLFNIVSAEGFLTLRNDSIIEDYANNFYAIGKSNHPSLIVAETDASYFGLRYIQSFDKEEDTGEVAIVSLPLFFHPWYLAKVQNYLPEFTLTRAEDIYRSKYINKDQDIIKPNLQRMVFFFTKGYVDGTKYKVTFFPLGRMLEEGKGINFKAFPIHINHRTEIDYQGPQAFTKLKLFYEYSHFDYAQGVEKAQVNDFNGAQKSMEETLKKVPYAYPAMSSLCMNFPDSYNFCKSTELQMLEEKTKYFY